MTAHRQVTLTCNADGCQQTFAGTVKPESVWDTRNEAYQNGWRSGSHPYGLDYCPSHQVEAAAVIRTHWYEIERPKRLRRATETA
jgi:hypothetical protein